MLKPSGYLQLTVFFLILYSSFVTHEIDCSQEKKIVVVIPSYNNKKWYKRNLDSVLDQDYSNYQVIYTDDVSTDDTGNLVAEYIKKYDHRNKITLVRNKERQGALYNLYRMVHCCDDDVIVVTLDGDDWLPDDNVLRRLNVVYSSEEVWLTYGQFQMHPHGAMGWATAMPEEVVKNNSFRDYVHLPTHLRTFYAWLFKKIKLEDFLYNGQFFTMTWDMAMMFPMIEMAGKRHRFIADVMYIYNDDNSISDHRISRQLQAHLAQVIRNKKPYNRLNNRPIDKIIDDKRADLIVFSGGSSNQLERLIEEIKKYVTGAGQINILYRVNSSEEAGQYNALKRQYSSMKFFAVNHVKNSPRSLRSRLRLPRKNFLSLFGRVYKNLKSEYVFFIKDNSRIMRSISLNQCINALEQTQAYGFYFKVCREEDFTTLSPNLSLIELGNDIYAWDFSTAHHVWSCANTLDMSLYRKNEFFLTFLQGYCEPTPQGFEAIWANEGLLNRVGLCHGVKRVEKIDE